jgi:hypothetical protein
MPTAILITFEYVFKSLPGAVVDLYHAFTWCRSFECDIHILTDIESIKDPNNLEQVVKYKIADKNILTFYDDILTGNSSKNNIKDSLTLLNSLNRILSLDIPDNKLIIYYSGHGVKDSMIMPNKSLLSFIDFRDHVINLLKPYVEIFWILDCCNPNGLQLPYKLTGNTFALSSSQIKFVTQPILLITSSESNEKSIATKFGSVFTRHLFRILNQLNIDMDRKFKKRISIPIQKNRNLRRLIGNLTSSIRKMGTGYIQTVSIYSSYVMDPLLWMWIGSNKSYDIVIDLTLTTLIFRNFDSSIKSIPIKKHRKPRKEKFFNPYDLVYTD